MNSSTSLTGGGGGYYSHGYGGLYNTYGIGKIGGQGSLWGNYWIEPGRTLDTVRNYYLYLYAKAGDGGTGGKGGNVYYDSNVKIYAYNGSMITSDDVPDSIVLRDKDGNDTATVLEKITIFDKTLIPTYIFCQSGVCRATYVTNVNQRELDKVNTNVEHELIQAPDSTNAIASYECFLSNNEKPSTVTGYSDGYILNQGIGSGAGYLELDNGYFGPIN